MLNKNKLLFKKFTWLRIFYHNMQQGGPFANQSEARHSISDYKYSILEDVSIDPKYKYKGKYEFLIEFSDTKGYNWWRQSIFPLYEDDNESIGSNVTGYEDVSIRWRDNNWGGLAHTVREHRGCIPSLLDGSIKITNFYYTIGNNNCYGGYPKLTPSNTGPGVNEVTLWMRVSSFDKISCHCYQRRKCTDILYLLHFISA